MNQKRKKIGIYNSQKTVNRERRKNKALSAILGTILLLSIAISLISVLYIVIINTALNSPTTPTASVSIVGVIEGDKVILEHRGGVPLANTTEIMLTIAGAPISFIVNHNFSDTNKNGMWDIGEPVIYNYAPNSLNFLEVTVKVIDSKHNNVIMYGVIQEGETGDFPYVQTLPASGVTIHSAKIWMFYNFIKSTYTNKQIQFRWKRASDSTWNTTIWQPVSVIANYSNLSLSNLDGNTLYIYQARIQYNTSIIKNGTTVSFHTNNDLIGMWPFNESSGAKVNDTSGNMNNGFLKPSETNGPTRVPGYSNRALELDGINDYVQINTSTSLNITEEITLDAYVRRSPQSMGTTGLLSTINRSRFGYLNYGCFEPNIIQVNGSIYAIVSRNETNKGFLITVNVSDDGVIRGNNNTFIKDIYEFENGQCITPKIIKLNGNNDNYAIVYRGNGDKGNVTTVQIHTNGSIEKHLLGHDFFYASCYHPDIIHIYGETYAVVFSNYSTSPYLHGTFPYYGHVVSLWIQSNALYIHTNDSYFCRTAGQYDVMVEPEIIMVKESIHTYVIVYNGRNDDGEMQTINITNEGAISSCCAEVKFDGGDGQSPDIIHVSGDIYAVVYSNSSDNPNGFGGTIRTFNIPQNGTLVSNSVRSHLTDPTNYQVVYINQTALEIPHLSCKQPHIIRIAFGSTYVVAYYGYINGFLRSGKLKTFQINVAGHISPIADPPPYSHTVTFDSFYCVTPDIIQLSASTGMYGLVYRADDSDGVLKTIHIQGDGTISSDPVHDARELGSFNCNNIRILPVSPSIIGIVYQGINAGGFIKTIQIDANGHVENSFKDTFTIEQGYWSDKNVDLSFYEPAILQIHNDIYAIVYRNGNSNGWLKTVQIDGSGHITLKGYYRFIDSSTYPTTCIVPTIINVSGSSNKYAIAFFGGGYGWLKTVQIDDTGVITSTLLSSFTFAYSTHVDQFSIVHVTGETYALAFLGSDASGWLATVQIFSTGDIRPSINDTYEFDVGYYNPYYTVGCFHPDAIMVNTHTVAIAYAYDWYTGYSGRLRTVEIASNGSITHHIAGSLVFQSYTSGVCNPIIIHISGLLYAILSKNPGMISIVRIGENGDIGNTIDASMLLPVISSYDADITPLTGNVYTLASGGANTDIYVQTIRINTTTSFRTIISKAGAYELKANATTAMVNIIDSSGHSYNVSGPLVSDWNHITASYNRAMVRLYINNVLYDHAAGYKKIRKTSSNLIFGYYGGTYDEFSIYGSARDSTGHELPSPPNQKPIISDPHPQDGSYVSQSLHELSVNISDVDGFISNWTIQCSNGQRTIGWDDGHKTCPLSGLSLGKTYTWWVNATDDTNATNSSRFIFHARADQAVVVDWTVPANRTIDESIYLPYLQAFLRDPDGPRFNWSIECNGYHNEGNNSGNGSYYLNIYHFQYDTVYNWWVNATDIYGATTHKWLWFRTVTPPPEEWIMFDSESPADKDDGVPVDLAQLSVDMTLITNPNVPFNWGITCSNGDHKTDSGYTGVKTLHITHVLNPLTLYTWLVYAVDSVSGTNTSTTYQFSTGPGNQPVIIYFDTKDPYDPCNPSPRNGYAQPSNLKGLTVYIYDPDDTTIHNCSIQCNNTEHILYENIPSPSTDPPGVPMTLHHENILFPWRQGIWYTWWVNVTDNNYAITRGIYTFYIFDG